MTEEKICKKTNVIMRIPCETRLAPGDIMSISVDEQLDISNEVFVVPTKDHISWIRPGPRMVRDSKIVIKNNGSKNIRLGKHAHVAHVFSCRTEENRKKMTERRNFWRKDMEGQEENSQDRSKSSGENPL